MKQMTEITLEIKCGPDSVFGTVLSLSDDSDLRGAVRKLAELIPGPAPSTGSGISNGGGSVQQSVYTVVKNNPGARAREVAAILGMPPPNVSSHLHELKNRELVVNGSKEQGTTTQWFVTDNPSPWGD